MNASSETVQRWMTPDEVLGVLRALLQPAGARKCRVLTHETTIAEAFSLRTWLMGWTARGQAALDLAEALNEVFRTTIDEAEFLSVLLPFKQRTIGDLCRLLARHAQIPILEPHTPERALAILTALLNAAGACAEPPSLKTPLEPYLQKCRKVFERDMVRLGAGRVPMPTIEYPAHFLRYGLVVMALFIAGWLAALTGMVLTSLAILPRSLAGTWFAACLIVAIVPTASHALLMLLSYWRGFARPRLGDMETFGDLVQTLLEK